MQRNPCRRCGTFDRIECPLLQASCIVARVPHLRPLDAAGGCAYVNQKQVTEVLVLYDASEVKSLIPYGDDSGCPNVLRGLWDVLCNLLAG